MIRLDGVGFGFSSHPARNILDSIQLTIEDGEWVAVTGANGSGKSVLCKLIAGLYRPSDGRVLIDGEDPRTAAGPDGFPSVGIAFQNPDSQFVTSGVRRELLFGLENIGMNAADRKRRVLEAAALFELEGLLRRNPHMLSGGEKQRLLLACIWAMRPRHIILDEPFSFLDAPSRRRALDTVRSTLHDEGRTVVWSTLDPAELELADRVICLDGGGVVFDGKPHEAIDMVPDGILIDRSPAAIVEADRGADLERHETAREDLQKSADSERPVVLMEGALISYGDAGFQLDIPSLGIARGEAVGIVGESGSGKTTLLLGCSGLVPLERGRRTLFGEEIISRKDFPAGRVALLFQSPEEGFFAPTVKEEVALGNKRFGDGRPDDEAAREALARVGLDPDSFMNRSPFHLSQGEKRLAALASQLVLPAEFALLDEPALFLDGRARASLMKAIEGLIDSGVTLAVASHDAPFIESIATRTLALHSGSLGSR